MASSEVCGSAEANQEACYWRRYCQGERLGGGRATTIESCDRHRVGARRMRVCHTHRARRRIAGQRALEIGRGGNIDARGVGRRSIRRNRCVSTQRKGRVWIVAKRRGFHGRQGQQDRRDKDQSDGESDLKRRSACEVICFRFHIFLRLNVRFKNNPSRCRCCLLPTSCEKRSTSCAVVLSAPAQSYGDMLTADSSSGELVSFSSVRVLLMFEVD